MTTLAFDIYGTTIDTTAVSNKLDTLVGDLSALFTQQWRDKQLEYSFRRGLMRDYVSFPVCTEQALNYTDELLDTGLSKEDKKSLMELYQVLPAFDDVVPALQQLQEKNAHIYAFSNGTTEGVENLLNHAGISDYFMDIISVDEVKTFKPSPDTYHHLLKRTHAVKENCWLISSNPFDVLGAQNTGLKTAWVRRTSKSVFDPWETTPTKVISNLTELVSIV